MNFIPVNIPDGQSGEWRIDTFTVTEEGAKWHNLRCLMNGNYRAIIPGTYKRLSRGGYLVMTNTPAETRDHYPFISACKRLGGDVLINGLGLGMALSEILKLSNITSVTVIEISKDVIKLVGPNFKNDKRVTIINADALEWKAPKGTKYSIVWHDIWDDICWDNLASMAKLHRKYGKRCEWQWSWCRNETHSLR